MNDKKKLKFKNLSRVEKKNNSKTCNGMYLHKFILLETKIHAKINLHDYNIMNNINHELVR